MGSYVRNKNHLSTKALHHLKRRCKLSCLKSRKNKQPKHRRRGGFLVAKIMSKETLKTDLEIQDRLWGKLCGSILDQRSQEYSGLNKKIRRATSGHLPSGLTSIDLSCDGKGFETILGDFAPRVLMVSDPNNAYTLIPEQLAIAGGWCALRTKDVTDLSQQGIIMNPLSGELEKITSVDQVASWIGKSIAFDQIIESVGPVKGAEYAVISERRLWSERIALKLSRVLERTLTPADKNKIERAIDQADIARAIMTEKYLKFLLGDKDGIVFRRVVDDDIWQDLKQARNEMLRLAGLSIEGLKRKFPKENAAIESSSLVWSMYSEPYFDTLRKNGYIRNKTVFIAEPILHACAETLPENELSTRVYQNKGVYFDPDGFNPNTGFIAYIECLTSRGENIRRELRAGEVPNIANWQRLFNGGEMIDPESNAVLNPPDNKIFLWGTNLLPYGKTREALLALVDIQEEFKKERKMINSQFMTGATKPQADTKSLLQRKTGELREAFEKRVVDENIKIAIQLKELFAYLTCDL